MTLSRVLPFALSVFVFLASTAAFAEIKLEKTDDGVVVKVDDKLFTVYRIKTGPKPILWPVIGPSGKEMTRNFPMKEVAGEAVDHKHQRSFWLTHGEVNHANFWDENPGHGTIEHQGFDKVESGPVGIIVTRNLWKDNGGEVQCEDVRTLRFGETDGNRWIDFDAVIKPGKEPVTFKDTKEGAFGVRVAHSMAVDSKQGGKIINAEGETDKAAWGKRSPWVDYQGPVDGETVGLAILNHPSSFRFPTYWHVRGYGLFAANPFGVKDFTADKTANGAHTIKVGETMHLRYRVILHRGDEKAGKIAEAFAKFSAEK